LRIGVIPTVAPYLLPALLRGLRRALPELQPEVREERTAALLAELGTGRLDVALIALPAEASGVSEIPLYDEDFVLLVPQGHRYSGGSNLSPAALQGQHLLLLDDGHCLRDQALELCRRAGVDPVASPAARTTSLTTVVQLVSSGLGTTLLPETALAAESRRGALAVARFCEPAPGRRIGLVYRASSARGTAYHELAHVIRRAASRLPIHPVAATG
ncbi:MAG TPA: LysR substrate-binding domain-containing protein, partial [Actinomycetes bacterium]|nr:LysR substrate-binding domain-containing protein [Actinomycetes bacterium]